MKLFRTTVTYTYYSWAKDWLEADGFANDAAEDIYLFEHTDTEVADASYLKSDGWDEKCLVYKKYGSPDMTVGEALAALATPAPVEKA